MNATTLNINYGAGRKWSFDLAQLVTLVTTPHQITEAGIATKLLWIAYIFVSAGCWLGHNGAGLLIQGAAKSLGLPL